MPNTTKKITPGSDGNITKDKKRFLYRNIKSDGDRNPYDIEANHYELRNFYQAGLLPSGYTEKTQAARLPDPTYFRDPYPRKYKGRLSQAYEFDYAVNASSEVLIHYILGRDLKATIYPTTRNQLNNDEEIDQALTEAGLDKTEREDLQVYIDSVDLNCELRSFLKGALSQAFTYGRSALYIKRANSGIESHKELADLGFKKGTPTQLLPLNSYYLGQVSVDPNTWEVKTVEYQEGEIFGTDPVTKRPYDKFNMPIKDIIYFVHKNYNIVPKSYNYGMALLQAIVPVSEVNRRLNERVFPEVNTSQWAGSGIIKFEGLNQRDMDDFTQSLMQPGNWKATNQSFSLETYKLNIDGQFLLDQRNENIRQILMQLRIPSVLMNFENVTNRSTTETVISVWQETVLENYRDWLRETMWKYWYRPLMEDYFGSEKEFLYMKVKIVMEFMNIDFSSLIEKAVSISNLVATGIISVREAREILKLPPFPPDQEQAIEMTTKLIQQNPDMVQQPGQQQGQQQQVGQSEEMNKQPDSYQQSQTGGKVSQGKKKPLPVKLSKSALSGDIAQKYTDRAISKAKRIGSRKRGF